MLSQCVTDHSSSGSNGVLLQCVIHSSHPVRTCSAPPATASQAASILAHAVRGSPTAPRAVSAR
eukprot:4063293-Alexandrium_andersonii.AAC.1